MSQPRMSPTGADAPREKTFLLARPEQRLLEAIARRLPALRAARPPDRLRWPPRSRSRSPPRPGDFVDSPRRCSSCTGSATRSTGRSRASAARRAPALRLLPRPPRRRVRDRAGRPRPRAVRAHAPGGRARARDRLPRAVDQLVPGDAGARALLARLRAARPDRGAAGADRAARRGRARRRGRRCPRADAARPRRRSARAGGDGRSRSAARARGEPARAAPQREPYTAP